MFDMNPDDKVYVAHLLNGLIVYFTASSEDSMFWMNAATVELQVMVNPQNPQQKMVNPIFRMFRQYAEPKRDPVMPRLKSEHIIDIYPSAASMAAGYRNALNEIFNKTSPIQTVNPSQASAILAKAQKTKRN